MVVAVPGPNASKVTVGAAAAAGGASDTTLAASRAANIGAVKNFAFTSHELSQLSSRIEMTAEI